MQSKLILASVLMIGLVVSCGTNSTGAGGDSAAGDTAAGDTAAGDTAAEGETATLSIHSTPSGTVTVDGKEVGTTPIDKLPVDVGAREVVIRRDGFIEWRKSVDVAANQPTHVAEVLRAKDPADPVAFAELARSLELEPTELEQSETLRSSKKLVAILPLFPRGKMRPDDLDEYRIDVSDAFEAEGKIEFRVGSKVLYSAPFEPEEFVTTASIPEAVRSGTKPGQTVKWGFYPSSGRPIIASFKIAKPDRKLEKREKAIDERMEGQADLLRDQMRAQLWLNKRLFYAAYRDAKSVVDRAEAAPQCLAIMQASLRRMDLKDCALWVEIEDKVKRLPSRYRPRHGPG
jgi:hypothetical protein